MDTLRSPKMLPGPALGIPSLTLSRLVRGCLRGEAWEALYKIQNADLGRVSLRWLQRVLSLPVEHEIAVSRHRARAGGS